jgi:crotonobetainyl-CoA:carnitine CoA-transferase CaiB-like acyl-CoA transferase
VLELVESADAIIEGFRPGVMERLGIGPDACLERNPRLVYGRMTGWGQTGPLAPSAAHDINYIAISGALNAIGRPGGPPTPPLNLVGDYAGAIYLAFGIVSAVLSSRETGQGQVVDASISESSAHLMTHAFGMAAAGLPAGERGSSILDGSAPYYDSYACKDGKYISIGAIETKFFTELLTRLGFDHKVFPEQDDIARREEMRQAFANRFLEKTREEWCSLLEGTDACFAPVLSLPEAAEHPQYAARNYFQDIDGIVQPGPAPRFSHTVPAKPAPPQTSPYMDPAEGLAGWLSPQRIEELTRPA